MGLDRWSDMAEDLELVLVAMSLMDVVDQGVSEDV